MAHKWALNIIHILFINLVNSYAIHFTQQNMDRVDIGGILIILMTIKISSNGKRERERRKRKKKAKSKNTFFPNANGK